MGKASLCSFCLQRSSNASEAALLIVDIEMQKDVEPKTQSPLIETGKRIIDACTLFVF
jgi:hypothetical protein